MTGRVLIQDPNSSTGILAEGHLRLTPQFINAFVQVHKSLEVEALYAQAPIRTHAYRMCRVCKHPRSSLRHLPEMSNRPQKCLPLLGNSPTIAIPAIQDVRSRLDFSEIFASRLSRCLWSSAATLLNRAASGRGFYSDFKRSARVASRLYSSAIRSMEALACGMTDRLSTMRSKRHAASLFLLLRSCQFGHFLGVRDRSTAPVVLVRRSSVSSSSSRTGVSA